MPVVKQRTHHQDSDDEEENEAAAPLPLRLLALLLITALLLVLVAGPAGLRILFRHGHFPPRNSWYRVSTTPIARARDSLATLC